MGSSSSPRLVATIVALGVANALVAAWTWRRRIHRGNDSQANANPTREKETNQSLSSPKARDDDGPSEDASLVPPFPWEPSKSSDDDSGGSSSTNPHHPSKKIPPSEAVQQLEFLSNMTFANGGLRAPNCPCCI
jgi:hypothetical protein